MDIHIFLNGNCFFQKKNYIFIFHYSTVRTFVTPHFSGGKRRKSPEKPSKFRFLKSVFTRLLRRFSPEKWGVIKVRTILFISDSKGNFLNYFINI